MSENNLNISRTRASIEADIIEVAARKTFTREFECFMEDNVLEFLKLWFELADYYRDHKDYDINVEVVREYIDWKRYLSIVSNSESKSESCREEAFEALSELDAHMNTIIKNVEFRLYPNGR